MIYVAMLPEQQAEYEEWLKTRHEKLGRTSSAKYDESDTLVYIVMHEDMEWEDVDVAKTLKSLRENRE